MNTSLEQEHARVDITQEEIDFKVPLKGLAGRITSKFDSGVRTLDLCFPDESGVHQWLAEYKFVTNEGAANGIPINILTSILQSNGYSVGWSCGRSVPAWAFRLHYTPSR